jgi:hypothetical protein
LSFSEIGDAYYDSRLLGHAKLDTTALYTRVATKTIREVMSPLEHIALKLKEARPPA